MRSRIGLRTAGAMLAAGATAVFGVAIALAPNALAAPSLSMSPTTVKAGTTVQLHGTGFPTTPASLYITICGYPPSATNCDATLSHVKQLAYNGSGSFKISYLIAVTKFTSQGGQVIDCAKVQCVVGTSDVDPTNQTYTSMAKFTVASAAKPTPTPTPSKSSSSPAASPTGPELPHTGADSSTPLVAGAAGVAVLAGLGLMVISGRRRRSRQH